MPGEGGECCRNKGNVVHEEEKATTRAVHKNETVPIRRFAHGEDRKIDL